MKANKILFAIILAWMMTCGMSFGMEHERMPQKSWYRQAQEAVGYYIPQSFKNVVNKMSEYKQSALLLALAGALGVEILYRNPDGTIANIVKPAFSKAYQGAGQLAEGGKYLGKGLAKASHYAYANPKTAAAAGTALGALGVGGALYSKYKLTPEEKQFFSASRGLYLSRLTTYSDADLMAGLYNIKVTLDGDERIKKFTEKIIDAGLIKEYNKFFKSNIASINDIQVWQLPQMRLIIEIETNKLDKKSLEYQYWQGILNKMNELIQAEKEYGEETGEPIQRPLNFTQKQLDINMNDSLYQELTNVTLSELTKEKFDILASKLATAEKKHYGQMIIDKIINAALIQVYHKYDKRNKITDISGINMNYLPTMKNDVETYLLSLRNNTDLYNLWKAILDKTNSLLQ